MKVKFAKSLVLQLKNQTWNHIYFDSYSLSHFGYNIFKRKISQNYWRFVVTDDTTSCSFIMYQKEKKHDP